MAANTIELSNLFATLKENASAEITSEILIGWGCLCVQQVEPALFCFEIGGCDGFIRNEKNKTVLDIVEEIVSCNIRELELALEMAEAGEDW